MWLLIYGREKAKLVVAKRQYFSSNIKIKYKFSNKGSGMTLKFSQQFLKGRKCSSMNRHC